MEITLESIISIISLLVGGTGLGTFFTWRWSRKKAAAEAAQAEAAAEQAKAEAEQAKVEMAKQVQDIYQQALADRATEIDDKNRIISELRQDRDHFRSERNELRTEVEGLRSDMNTLKDTQARQGRQIAAMRPFLCADLTCRKRQRVASFEDVSNPQPDESK